jgi:hypothetical protein
MRFRVRRVASFLLPDHLSWDVTKPMTCLDWSPANKFAVSIASCKRWVTSECDPACITYLFNPVADSSGGSQRFMCPSNFASLVERQAADH